MDKRNLENRNYIILLIDAYGNLLTDKQRYILELYFFEDLSLVEIAKINNSSRQSILYSINNSVNQLEAFEKKVKVLEKDEELKVKKGVLVEILMKHLDYDSNLDLYNFIENM